MADNTETGSVPVTTTVPSPAVATSPSPNGMTVDQGVEAFVKARTAAREAQTATPKPAESAPTVQATSGEAGQSGEDVETGPAADETDNTVEESATVAEPAETESAPQLPTPDSVVFLLDDGTPVTAAEARKSHYRQADYTRDKQSLSEIRNVVQGRSQLTDQAAKFFADNMPTVLEMLEQRIPPEPDPALRSTDAFKYWDQYNERQAALYKLQQAQLMQQGTQQAHQELSLAKQQEAFQLEQDLLLKALPTWRDQKVRSRELNEITKYAVDRGYKPEELNVTDHRLVMILADAVLGHKARKIGQNGKASPPQIREPTIGANNVVQNVSRQNSANRERERLKQTATTGQDGLDRMSAALKLLGPRRPERARTR